jgi:carboxymethylenebutenolidase
LLGVKVSQNLAVHVNDRRQPLAGQGPHFFAGGGLGGDIERLEWEAARQEPFLGILAPTAPRLDKEADRSGFHTIGASLPAKARLGHSDFAADILGIDFYPAAMIVTNNMKLRFFLWSAVLLAGLNCGVASAQDWAKAKLEKSSRHGEWVDVTNGTRAVHCFVVYPEVKDPALAVVVIHDIFGMTDWARETGDQLAAAGYIAIVPDLLSGQGTNGAGTSGLGSQEVGRAIQGLPKDQITGDLNAAANYVKALPSANGKLAVAGFCWGGGESFSFACNRPDLKAALVFYGTAPTDAGALAKINCPVYGFYGGNDARVSATIPKTEEMMKAAGKTYEPVKYEGAGHGFMKSGEQPDAQEANKKAYDEAWQRVKSVLGKL